MVAMESWFRKPASLKLTTAAWTHPVAVPGSGGKEEPQKAPAVGAQMSHSPKLGALGLLAAFCPEYQGPEAGGSHTRHRIQPLEIWEADRKSSNQIAVLFG